MKCDRTIKEKVRILRSEGNSLNEIFDKTHVPKTTIRSWIKDIILNEEQLEKLKENTQKALQAGRIRKQNQDKILKVKNETKLKLEGGKEIGELTKRDLLIAGIALYWAEGFKNKHEHRLGFCNSDPGMIKFYLEWAKEILNVKQEDLVARLSLNIYSKNKEEKLQKFWSNLTGIPTFQFSKTFYQKSKWKRQYKNDTYLGVLRLHVKNSGDQLLKMKGWIDGLKFAKIGKLPG